MKSIIVISQILRYACLRQAMYLLAMCWSQYPPNFSGKKGKDQNSVFCTLKKIAYFWFPQGVIIFPGGVRQKMEFWEGRGGPFREPILENPEGRGVIGKIPSLGGYGYFLELHNVYLTFILLSLGYYIRSPLSVR